MTFFLDRETNRLNMACGWTKTIEKVPDVSLHFGKRVQALTSLLQWLLAQAL